MKNKPKRDINGILVFAICLQIVLVLGYSARVCADETVMNTDTLMAEKDSGIDVVQYFNMTFEQIKEEIPGLFEAVDTFGTGKTFLTNGKVSFYFGFWHDDTLLKNDSKINRIVISANDTGRYRIGEDMCICATYGDEGVYMKQEGFEKVYTLGDRRNIWANDEYIVIVTRGPYASCCEIDVSKNVKEEN